MIFSLILVVLNKYFKNNKIIKIDCDQTISPNNLLNIISGIDCKIKTIIFIDNNENIEKIDNNGNIKKIENNEKTIIVRYIKDGVKTKKIILNNKIYEYVLTKCIKKNINFTFGNKISSCLTNNIYNDIKFLVKYIVGPFITILLLTSILNIINIFSQDNNFNIMQTKQELKKFNISLSKWVGSPEIFDECVEIISYQNNKSNYKKLGAILPKGILFEGPPGVGKTYLAKVIASETNSNFISISGSEFVEKYVGVGALRIRNMFKMARSNLPCIIFIDEIDAIGIRRSNGENNREHDQTLNQLLSEMDGFNDNNNILILGATNRKNVLDPALLRPGRFDRHVHIGLPDKQSRKQILKLYIDDKKKKEKNIDIETIADLTNGFSGADLKNLVNEAAILAARKGKKMIGSIDLMFAMEKLIVGLEKAHDDRSEETIYRIAIHEVGHSFLTIYFQEYFNLQKISIKSTYNGAGGYSLIDEKSEFKTGGLYTKDLLEKKIVILLGGKAAESIWYGDNHISLGSTQDLKQSNQLGRKMVEIFGMGSGDLEIFFNTEIENYSQQSLFSDNTKEQIDREIFNITSNAYFQAKNILNLNKNIFMDMVDKLVENKVLYRKDLNYFYEIIKKNK